MRVSSSSVKLGLNFIESLEISVFFLAMIYELTYSRLKDFGKVAITVLGPLGRLRSLSEQEIQVLDLGGLKLGPLRGHEM